MSKADDIIITMNEFRMALEEIKPAFGVSEDELKRHLRGELIPYSAAFDQIMGVGASARLLVVVLLWC